VWCWCFCGAWHWPWVVKLPDLILTSQQLLQIAAHLSACLPEEACGLIGGSGSRAGLVLPVENELHSPVRFQMAPLAQFQALTQIESAEMDLLAIFHSHPAGPPHPSATDVAEFYYPGTLVLIASPLPDAMTPLHEGGLAVGTWQINGYQINKDGILAVKLGMSD
jgi:proteasome lid subunit RPN8/RPN11